MKKEEPTEIAYIQYTDAIPHSQPETQNSKVCLIQITSHLKRSSREEFSQGGSQSQATIGATPKIDNT